MDDAVLGEAWTLTPETRVALRFAVVRDATKRQDWPRVVLEAEELLDEHPDHAEALLELANALLELGDAENAADAYEDHIRLTDRPCAHTFSGLAIARYDAWHFAEAIEAARRAIRLDPSCAEAHYTLGLCLERTGRPTEAAAQFHTAMVLDPERFPLPMDLDDATVARAIHDALPSLPPVLLEFWREIPIYVEEEPTLDARSFAAAPPPPSVVGLYVGMPEGPAAFERRPEALKLFRKNLARCGTYEELTAQIARLLEQEALDWLGVSLDELMSIVRP